MQVTIFFFFGMTIPPSGLFFKRLLRDASAPPASLLSSESSSSLFSCVKLLQETFLGLMKKNNAKLALVGCPLGKNVS